MYAVLKNNIENKIAVLFFALIAFSIPLAANAASLRVVPTNSSLTVGETTSIAVTITSDDQPMNAAEGVMKFPTDLLQVVGISKAGSILGLWVQEPAYSNSLGTVNFEGVALNPGYTGSNGTVLTIIFRARAEGAASLTIDSASVLANDGNGTQIFSGSSGGTISIGPAAPAPVKPKSQPSTEPVKTKEPVKPVQPAAPTEPPPAPSGQKVLVEKPFDLSRYFAWLGDVRSLIFAIVIITFGILNVLLFMQYLRLRKKEGGSLDHAQIVAHRSFLILRDDVDTFAQELEEESKKRELTPTERRFVKEMRGDLTSAEKAIVKELRDNEKRSQ